MPRPVPKGRGQAAAVTGPARVSPLACRPAEGRQAWSQPQAVDSRPGFAYCGFQDCRNLGDFALAVSSLEQYLALDPNGPKAAEVKASLPALQKMVKK